MRKTIVRLLLIALICAMVLPTTGCIRPYNKPKYVEIGPSETAFMLPMEGDTAEQAKFESEAFLEENKVAAKRVQIPRHAIKTGRMYWQIEYVDDVMLIKIDRAPVTREWTETTDGGTAAANQGITAQSLDGISYLVRVNCTAQIREEDAAKYLYMYRNKTLDQVMDTEIRPQVEKLFVAAASGVTYDAALQTKAQMMAAVEEQVKEFFLQRGITITQIGLKGEFTPLDPKVAAAYAAVAAANQERIAQEQINAKNVATAQAKAEEARLMSSNVSLQLKQLELQKQSLDNQANWIAKWNGVVPTYMLGENANLLFGAPGQ